MKRVCVTGGTGFVGKALVERFLSLGDEVHVLVREGRDALPLSKAGAMVHAGSILDPNDIAAAAMGCDVFVHAAAATSLRLERKYLREVNVAGTENALRAARHVGCTRFVYLSCADVTLCNAERVFWNADRVPTAPLLDDHAASKALAEELVLASSHHDFSCAAIRPAFVWGPGDFKRVLELWKQAGDRGIGLVGSGNNLFPTTYIGNLVHAIVATTKTNAPCFRAYYITDGDALEAREFFEHLSRALQLPRPRRGLPYDIAFAIANIRKMFRAEGRRPSDVAKLGRSAYFDIQRAMDDFSYKPLFSVEQGLKALSAWVDSLGGIEAMSARSE